MNQFIAMRQLEKNINSEIHRRRSPLLWRGARGEALTLLTLLFLLAAHTSAQTVRGVSAEQQGQQVVVSYELQTDAPCEVSLHVSLDQGKTWSDGLSQCTGAVGKNISSGRHSITWNVLAERTELWGDGIRFRVKASSKKSYEPEMVFVDGGTFMMGSNSGEDDEKPVHEVTLSSYYIGKYEVTQAQWRAVMGNNPSYFQNCDDCPVEQVSWNDIQGYIQKLNAQTGKQYRLPTEAEWEYAARGGNKSRNYTFSGSDDINSVAWYDGNSGDKTHKVGGKQYNELGIYDMSGNVWEWCADWYGNYSSARATNPKGPSSGESRLLRGGSWYGNALFCRYAFRFRSNPDGRSLNRGFRLVFSPSSP